MQCASCADEVDYINVWKINKYNKLNDAENVESDQVNAGFYIHVNRIRYKRTECNTEIKLNNV